MGVAKSNPVKIFGVLSLNAWNVTEKFCKLAGVLIYQKPSKYGDVTDF
jgi:hypothetical protein